jgi:plasmid stabilization system protein ParE
VADVRLSAGAVKDLDHMIASHSLPFGTRDRVRRKLESLERFPRLGRQLEGRWHPLRLVFGPWPWMLILYSYEEADDLVLVVGFQDGRSSTAATTARP